MFNTKLLIVLGIIVLALVVTALVLFLLYRRRWPVKFTLEALEPNVVVDIYANNMLAFPAQKLPQNSAKTFVISDSVLNVRTQEGLKRDQLEYIMIYLPVDAQIKFKSVNVPNYSVELTKDRAGYSVMGQNDQMCPSGTYGSPTDLTDCVVCPGWCSSECKSGEVCCGSCVPESTCSPACKAGETCCNGGCATIPSGKMPAGCTTWQDTCTKCGLQKSTDLRDGNWKQAGYYHVSFPQGIPLF